MRSTHSLNFGSCSSRPVMASMKPRTWASRSARSSDLSFTRPLADSGCTAATGCGGVSCRSAGGVSSPPGGSAFSGADIEAPLGKLLLNAMNHGLQPFVRWRIDDIHERGRSMNTLLLPDLGALHVPAGP